MRRNWRNEKTFLKKAEILMPLYFKEMDANTILMKYPNQGSRPTEVYTNDNSSVNLVFTHSAKKATLNDIKKHTDELVDFLKQKDIKIIEQKHEK